MARADTVPSTPPAGSAWFDALDVGARAWMSTLTGLVRMSACVVEAQARIGGEMVSFWMRGIPTGALPAAPSLLGQELALTGFQAERVAKAAHQTLRDLNQDGVADIPVPLPE